MGRIRDLLALLTTRVKALETRQAQVEEHMSGVKASGGQGHGNHKPPPTPLVISAVNPVSVTAPRGSTGVTVTIPSPGITGGKAPYTVRTTPPSPSVFPIGVTTATITVTDSGSPQQSVSETTTVTVTAAPAIPALVISPIGTITVVAPAGSTSVPVTIPAPIVTGGTPPYTVRDVPASGSSFAPGSTPVTITVTDSGTPAQVATESTSVVVVVDPVGAGNGSTITVANGGDLQAALDSAVAGDTITVEAGASFDKITIPVFSGTDYITLRTSTADASFLSATTRATTAAAALMPTITSSTSDPAITFAAGAHHWRLIGLNIVDTIGLNDMVVIGTGLETSLADLPDDIIMDRCLVQGKTAGGTKRGLSLNASHATILNSSIVGIRRSGQDSQAIGIFQTPGPVLIENDYLEGASNAVLIGGSDPRITNQVPTNITIRGCSCFKPTTWAGFNVKNHIELKNAQTVLIENTICENSYPDAQIGYGLLFTVRNQDGGAAWSTVKDVTVRYVVLKNCTGPAIGLLGLDDRGSSFPSVQGTNLSISNILVLGTSDIFVTSQSGFQPTSITHCTAPAVTSKGLNFLPLVMPSGQWTYQNNVTSGGVYVIAGDDPNVGNIFGVSALNEFAPGAVFDHNVLSSPGGITLPAGNTVVTQDALTASLDQQKRYTGSATSTDGLPMGCDINGLLARIPSLSLGAPGGGGALVARVTVQTAGPMTMGLVLPEGALPAGSGLKVGTLLTQTDWLNTWGDGSLRHGLVSFTAPIAASLDVTASTFAGSSYTPTWPSASVSFDVSGTVYTATLPSFTATNTVCNGAVCRRAWVQVTPTTSGAVPHATLQVRFEVTSYVSGGHKVGITIQNIRNLSTMNQVTANVTTTVDGSTFAGLTKAAWTIYSGQRHYRTTWVSATEAQIAPDFEPWYQANVIPRFVAADPVTYDLTAPAYGLGGGLTAGQWFFGEAEGHQSDSENLGRQELNPWCDWEARMFLDPTSQHYRAAVLAHANVAGGWSWAVDKAGDGRTILRIDEDGNDLTVCTHPGAPSGLQWPTAGATSMFRGTFDSANTPGYPSVVVGTDPEHYPELSFVAYLLTGDTFYLDSLRFTASWAIFKSYRGPQIPDPVWPAFDPFVATTDGYLFDAGWTREFGRPLKQVARAAWAMPAVLGSPYTTDYTYFHTVTEHNLTGVAYYIGYLDGKSWGGSWGHFVGYGPGNSAATNYIRYNTVASTTGASPTVLTVVGDNSGIGTGTNDHGLQTGDFVDLAGFTSGASGLNGHHAVTRLTATTFSVAVNTTGSATSGIGTWSTLRGLKTPHWRISDAAREISWIGFTGLWTMNATRWAFPDRVALMEQAVQDNPDYDNNPALSHNYYPSPGYIAGDNIVFFTSWTDWYTANRPDSNSAYLFNAQADYAGGTSTTHRGNRIGYILPSEGLGNNFYTPYATTMFAHGAKRGLTGMAAAYDKCVAANTVLATLKTRPGFYQARP